MACIVKQFRKNIKNVEHENGDIVENRAQLGSVNCTLRK